MENSEIVKTQNKEITFVPDESLDDYLEVINHLSGEDQVSDARCKICKSKYRQEAEMLWEMTGRKRFTTLIEFFKERGEDMNINNVINHIRGHYLPQEQHIMRKQYADRLLPVIKHKINKIRRIEVFLAMLEDKAWNYASVEHESDDKRMKSADMLIRLVKQASELLKIQATLEGDLKPIQIVVDKFQQIFISALNKIEDPEIKMSMIKELENLKETAIIDV